MFATVVGMRCFSSVSRVCPRLAVVGAGPAGFYFATPILRELPTCTVDFFEKLPIPYGLIRFGVAPDHPEVKNCINQFQNTVTASQGRVRFRGNVEIGRDLSVNDLTNSYSSVIFCHGAESQQRLGIPGEDEPNVCSARSFVGWFNGLPGHENLEPDLDTETAMVFGHGNVALDVARILLSPVDDLARTDIADHALAALAKSRIRNVRIIGRRGPLQVSFTIKELREMTKLPNCEHFVSPESFEHISGEVIGRLARPRKRITELLRNLSASNSPDENKNCWFLEFLRSPVEIRSAKESKELKVTLSVNKLSDSGDRAVTTGETEVATCGLILCSVGYRSVPMPGLPFDSEKNVLATERGFRVRGMDGVYACGWCQSGPVGVIATTQMTAKACAMDVKSHLENCDGLSDPLFHIDALLQERGVRSVSWEDWLRVDVKEKDLGALIGKPRRKIISLEDVFAVLDS